jgi:nicotinamide phosphoribosyltransferase
MTLKGEDGELELMERVLKTYPTGIVACVSDSYNIFRACSEYWGTKLKELVLSRPSSLVINW